MITAHELAATLNGREYGKEITRTEEAEAKAAGLVVVFGASDDLTEFRGAINEEFGAYEGETFCVDSKGVRESWPEELVTEDWAREFFAREALPSTAVTAAWSEGGYSWIISTTIPNATFDIFEDGEPYCRGIVFALSDIGTAS